MITRVRNGKVEHFYEGAYAEPPKVKKIKDNLVENFGYGKIEARRIAYEILDNMQKYDRLEEIRARTQATMKALYDNHTRVPVRPKSILEQRMEAQRGNIRV